MLLDAEVLREASYSHEDALSAYRRYEQTGRFEDLTRAWEGFLPLLSTCYWHRRHHRRQGWDILRADELISRAAWDLWLAVEKRFLRGVTKVLAYIRVCARRWLARANLELTRGEDLAPDDYVLPDRGENSIKAIFDRLVDEEIKTNAETAVLRKSRWSPMHQGAISYVVRQFFRDKLPIKFRIEQVWQVEHPRLLIDWVHVRLKDWLIAHTSWRPTTSEAPYGYIC